MNDKDKKAFEKWYSKEASEVLWEEFNGDEIVIKAWQSACEYKQKVLVDAVEEVKKIEEENSILKAKLAEATDIIQDIVDSDDDRYNRPRYYSKCKEFLV